MTARAPGFYWVVSEPGRPPSVGRWDGSCWHLFGAVTAWTQDRVDRVTLRYLPADAPTASTQWVEDAG